MEWLKTTLMVETQGKGMYNFTRLVENAVQEWGVREGICHLFVQHTSASMVISESYDPSARVDMEVFMGKIAPEGQPWYRHTMEGDDDSPSHMRAMLTDTSLSIPVDDGQLNLGTWQGIYLFEHRSRGHHRRVLLRCLKVE
jgi:secondary thiamine-phosphate synthase enzyme